MKRKMRFHISITTQLIFLQLPPAKSFSHMQAEKGWEKTTEADLGDIEIAFSLLIKFTYMQHPAG